MEFNDLMIRFGAALGAGLLIGLQRQYAGQDHPDDLFAGTRTFALIALLGGMASYLSSGLGTPLVFVGVLVVLGGYVGVGYAMKIRAGDIGLTTEVAAVLTYLIGALAAAGELTIAAASAVAVTTLLALKPWTQHLVESIHTEDVEATLRFAVLAALILPLLPREPLGGAPFDAASPFQIGLMVVFISGLSFLGYALVKLVGPRRGVALTGLLGGLASSTAVTLTMSERSREAPRLLRVLAMTVMLAWSIMYVRVLIEVAVVNPDLLGDVVLPVIAGGLILVASGIVLYRKERSAGTADSDGDGFSNPFRLRPAIQFGLFYGAVLIGSKAASMYLGDAGVYTGAIVSGVVDVDAITLSMAELSRGELGLSNDVAANAIVIAAATNTVAKGAMVWVLGNPGLRRLFGPAVLATVAVTLALTFLT